MNRYSADNCRRRGALCLPLPGAEAPAPYDGPGRPVSHGRPLQGQRGGAGHRQDQLLPDGERKADSGLPGRGHHGRGSLPGLFQHRLLRPGRSGLSEHRSG